MTWWMEVLGVIIHNDGHDVCAETISFESNSFTESVCYVVGAQQPGNDDEDVEGTRAKEMVYHCSRASRSQSRYGFLQP